MTKDRAKPTTDENYKEYKSQMTSHTNSYGSLELIGGIVTDSPSLCRHGYWYPLVNKAIHGAKMRFAGG
jgi:hypothetical protein